MLSIGFGFGFDQNIEFRTTVLSFIYIFQNHIDSIDKEEEEKNKNITLTMNTTINQHVYYQPSCILIILLVQGLDQKTTKL